MDGGKKSQADRVDAAAKKAEDPLLHPARAKGEQPGAAGGVPPDKAAEAAQAQEAPQRVAQGSPKAKALQDRLDDSIGAAGAGPAA